MYMEVRKNGRTWKRELKERKRVKLEGRKRRRMMEVRKNSDPES